MTIPPTDDELRDWIAILTCMGQPIDIIKYQFLRTAEALLEERRVPGHGEGVTT